MTDDTAAPPHLVADATFAVVPTWVIRLAPSRAVHLYAILRGYADNGSGRAWPSRATLARELGCSPDTVDRAIAALRGIGALSVTHRWNDKREPMSNLYVVHALPPVQNPVDNQGGVAAPMPIGSRTSAQTVAAPVRHRTRPKELDPLKKNPPTPHGASSPRRLPVPEWCGECDAADRTHETDSGAILRCPLCHPAVAGRL